MSSNPPDPSARPITVRTTYLEITDPAAIVPARAPAAGAVLTRLVAPAPEFVRFLYTAIGGDWHWRDRLPWSWTRWRDWLSRPGLETWWVAVDGAPAGWFELDATSPPDVEIAYFGLLPAYFGQGLGGWLLEAALRRGFALGRRVWVHTCTLDGPVALAHYQARGLVPYRVEESVLDLPSEPPGAWSGAHRPRSPAP